ncbi:MAG: tRNA uridine-5-carboxymethylaminomethyl(34) synthesis GTPase MnmE [Mycoplasmoidaceae bacterium]|nr:tRNA uridine-5-carboxymethylaminomethyl(34) synthesis GTPase MnmE [Mycoplasmoidaceae bacterium]
MKTIVALATAPLNCAIHIIRVSGDDAFKIINKITTNRISRVGFSIQHTTIVDHDKSPIDDVLVMKYVAPKSYTGEDIIEINCHGGLFIASKIIELLVKAGCIYAKRGEFTQRALLNGKINLINAYGINNTINATNLTSLKLAQNSLNNKLTKKIQGFIEELFKLIGSIEVNIDYPEYDGVDNITNKVLIQRLTVLNKKLQELYEYSQISCKLTQGFNIALIGEPNVGKSSLLNKLIHENKAIVSNIPGTTRDIVEGRINYKDLTFNFVDTAGIRSKANVLESLGIKKTYQELNKADLILLVLDASKKNSKNENSLLKKIKNKNHLVILNKSDLSHKNTTNGFLFSCKKSKVSTLMDLIVKTVNAKDFSKTDMAYLQSADQVGTLLKAINQINQVIVKAKKKQPIDLLVEHLRSCYDLLNELVGNGDLDFLDKLFANFCVGK